MRQIHGLVVLIGYGAVFDPYNFSFFCCFSTLEFFLGGAGGRGGFVSGLGMGEVFWAEIDREWDMVWERVFMSCRLFWVRITWGDSFCGCQN
jgi:hypothetical protein